MKVGLLITNIEPRVVAITFVEHSTESSPYLCGIMHMRKEAGVDLKLYAGDGLDINLYVIYFIKIKPEEVSLKSFTRSSWICYKPLSYAG